MNGILLCTDCNEENTMFVERCVACGSRLPAMVTRHVRDDGMADRLRFRSPKMPKPSAEIVVLYLVGRPTPLVLESREQMVFGRREPGTRELIVDLSPFHGGAMGVSRKHVCLHRTRDGYFLEDLDSTNGTRLNGHLLAPYQPVPATNGARIQLGGMTFFLHFSLD